MRKAKAPAKVIKNKHQGAQFERIFLHRAQLCGLLALKNELSFRFQGGGRMLPLRTDLDFRVFNKLGQVAFLDMKSFDADHFTYSQITPHQLQRARVYERYNVPAGFVVWFKPSGRVTFFSGEAIFRAGMRSRFVDADGLRLGTLLAFDLRPIFLAR